MEKFILWFVGEPLGKYIVRFGKWLITPIPPRGSQLTKEETPSEAPDDGQRTPFPTTGVSKPTDGSEIMKKVFISYSHNDHNPNHKDAVHNLARELQSPGIHICMDLFESPPSKGWHIWSMNQIKEADFVLVVCSERYYECSLGNGQDEGVTWESYLISQRIYGSRCRNETFIPIVLTPEDSDFVPDFLRSVHRYRLYNYLEYRQLTDRLGIQKAATR